MRKRRLKTRVSNLKAWTSFRVGVTPMRLSRLARALLRMYPRPWRERYEDEVLRLMEDDPPDLAALMDLTRALGRERVFATLRWRPGESARLAAAGLGDMALLSGVGALMALLAVPTAAWAGAHGVHSDPAWLAVLVIFPFAAPLRWIAASLALNGDRWRWALVRDWELPIWSAIFFATCVVSCLPHVTTLGLSTPPLTQPLWTVAARGTQLQLFALGTRRQFDRTQRAKALREAARAARRNQLPRRPLGLS